MTACNSDPETEIAETEPPQLIDSTQAGQTLKYIDIIDTSRMTIIPLSNVGWMNENYTQAKLSIIKLAELDTLLFVSSEEYNQIIISDYEELMAFYHEEAEFMDETFVEWDFASDHTILDLSNYRRQYIPYYNELGEKVVHIYCDCLSCPYENWKYEVLAINDGGNCHFDVILNLTKGTCKRVSVNGYAYRKTIQFLE